MLANDCDGPVAVFHALRDIEIARARQWCFRREHRTSRPFDETGPHPSNQNQRSALNVSNLKELPDHHRFQNRADPAGCNNKSIGCKNEVMKTREEGPMLERK